MSYSPITAIICSVPPLSDYEKSTRLPEIEREDINAVLGSETPCGELFTWQRRFLTCAALIRVIVAEEEPNIDAACTPTAFTMYKETGQRPKIILEGKMCLAFRQLHVVV